MLTPLLLSFAGLSITAIIAVGIRKLFSMRRERRQATAVRLYLEGERYHLRYPTNFQNARIAYEASLTFDNTIAETHYRLGNLYQDGAGVEVNLKKARSYYDKAFSLGYTPALLALGSTYDVKTPDDYPRHAFSLYLKATEYLDSRADAFTAVERLLTSYPTLKAEKAYRLSQLFLEHHNTQKAAFWYIQAEQCSLPSDVNPLAQQIAHTPGFSFILGKAYEALNQKEVAWICYAKAQHCPESLHRLKTVADEGSAAAQYALGYYHFHPKDDQENAVSYCLKAAHQGYAPALTYLNGTSFTSKIYLMIAKAYQTGVIISKDVPQSLKFYKKASELGDKEAAFYLGQWYESTLNKPHTDLKTSLFYYTKALNAGHVKALPCVKRLQRTQGEGAKGRYDASNPSHASRKTMFEAWMRTDSKALKDPTLTIKNIGDEPSINTPFYR